MYTVSASKCSFVWQWVKITTHLVYPPIVTEICHVNMLCRKILVTDGKSENKLSRKTGPLDKAQYRV